MVSLLALTPCVLWPPPCILQPHQAGYGVEVTTPNSSSEIGQAKCPHCTTADGVCTMLFSAELKPKYWPSALRHFVFISNCLPHGNRTASALKLCTGHWPNLCLSFSCLAVISMPFLLNLEMPRLMCMLVLESSWDTRIPCDMPTMKILRWARLRPPDTLLLTKGWMMSSLLLLLLVFSKENLSQKLSISMMLLKICKCLYPLLTKLILLNAISVRPMFNLLVFRLNTAPVSSVPMWVPLIILLVHMTGYCQPLIPWWLHPESG